MDGRKKSLKRRPSSRIERKTMATLKIILNSLTILNPECWDNQSVGTSLFAVVSLTDSFQDWRKKD